MDARMNINFIAEKKLRNAAEEALANEILDEVVSGMCKKLGTNIFNEVVKISTIIILSTGYF